MRFLSSMYSGLFIFTLFMLSPNLFADPLSVYLTWQQEKTWDNITINHVSDDSSPVKLYLIKAGNGQSKARKYEIKAERLPGNLGYIHRFEVLNLYPDTIYRIKFEYSNSRFSSEKKFRTLPQTGAIKFLQGGDMGTSDNTVEVPRLALKKKPHVVMMGGDLAYANGEAKNAKYWKKWLKGLNEIITSEDGYLVPVVAALGNHEVSKAKKAPFFFSLFKQNNDKPYFARIFSDHTLFLVLDSGFYVSHKSQVPWMQKKLKQYAAFKNKVAMYHAPLYPSHRSFYDHYAKLGRKAWLSVFDEHHLTLAFENHDHAVKRTNMMIAGKSVSEGGTVFIGDGCWGRWPRDVVPNRYYLKKAKSIRHVWLGEFKKNSIDAKAYDRDLNVLDSFGLNTASRSKLKNL